MCYTIVLCNQYPIKIFREESKMAWLYFYRTEDLTENGPFEYTPRLWDFNQLAVHDNEWKQSS